MVRKFAPDPVPQPSIERILRNGVRGPSAGFCQGQAFLVLTGAELPKFWAVAGEATYGSVQTAAVHRARCRPSGSTSSSMPSRTLAARRRPLAEMIHYGQW